MFLTPDKSKHIEIKQRIKRLLLNFKLIYKIKTTKFIIKLDATHPSQTSFTR